MTRELTTLVKRVERNVARWRRNTSPGGKRRARIAALAAVRALENAVKEQTGGADQHKPVPGCPLCKTKCSSWRLLAQHLYQKHGCRTLTGTPRCKCRKEFEGVKKGGKVISKIVHFATHLVGIKNLNAHFLLEEI